MELHLDPSLDGDSDGPSTALPPRAESWRRRSAAGAILTGIALGLKEALEPRRQEPAIVVQVSGEPLEDLPVEAHLDDTRPGNSVVHIRPWLLADGGKGLAGDGSPSDAPAAGGDEAGPGSPAGGGGSTP